MNPVAKLKEKIIPRVFKKSMKGTDTQRCTDKFLAELESNIEKYVEENPIHDFKNLGALIDQLRVDVEQALKLSEFLAKENERLQKDLDFETDKSNRRAEELKALREENFELRTYLPGTSC